MITPLIAAALIATSGQVPDHLVSEAPVVQEINFKKPHKGGFSEEIIDAATVPKKWRPFAACVLERESGGSLDRWQSGSRARNPDSSASGRWQFLSSSWGQSLPYLIAKRLKDHDVPKGQAVEVRMELQGKPIHKWHGLWQDIGFLAVVTQPRGWMHWRYGDKCDGKRSR
jgi:hypothetical protein